ncbi:MAG: hypothetical protein PHG66_00725 [Candidatus Colwellbacteria bacterium]|nr:hypothetical protein [Candidatus Colwellbacteria bacterium]
MSSLTTKLSLQQYLLWNQNKDVNPKTGRKIKIDGPVYQEIEAGWKKLQESNDFTKSECLDWLDNKLVNPKTRKKIKEGGFVYEMIRNKCELYDVSKSDNKFYDDIIDGSRGSGCSGSDSESVSESDSESEMEERKESKPSCVKSKQPLSLVCKGEMCMMKGCVWNGKYGVNFTLFPKWFIKSISLFFPYLNTQRCCCFCFGHLILFLSFIGNKSATSCIPKEMKELTKVQMTIDRLESVEGSISENAKKVFIKEANTEMTKGVTNAVFKKGLPVLNTMMKMIKENGPGLFNSITSGLSTAVNIFSGNCD